MLPRPTFGQVWESCSHVFEKRKLKSRNSCEPFCSGSPLHPPLGGTTVTVVKEGIPHTSSTIGSSGIVRGIPVLVSQIQFVIVKYWFSSCVAIFPLHLSIYLSVYYLRIYNTVSKKYLTRLASKINLRLSARFCYELSKKDRAIFNFDLVWEIIYL